MPTNRHRRPRLRRSNQRIELGEHHREMLCTGSLFFEAAEPEWQRVAWAQYGSEITAQFIREHPGKRPWAWWIFDATELRRRLTKPRWKPDEMDTHHFAVAAREKMNPSAFDNEPCSFGLPRPFYQDSPFFESEAAYLERHGLLTAEEKTALAKQGDEKKREVQTLPADFYRVTGRGPMDAGSDDDDDDGN
jgi:hypothetical protein